MRSDWVIVSVMSVRPPPNAFSFFYRLLLSHLRGFGIVRCRCIRQFRPGSGAFLLSSFSIAAVVRVGTLGAVPDSMLLSRRLFFLTCQVISRNFPFVYVDDFSAVIWARPTGRCPFCRVRSAACYDLSGYQPNLCLVFVSQLDFA